VSLYAALSDALAQKPGLVRRFYLGWFKSWVDMLYDRAYSMKLGVTHLPGGRAFMVNEMSLVEKVLGDAGNFPSIRWSMTCCPP
jgi:hypothetical protein